MTWCFDTINYACVCLKNHLRNIAFTKRILHIAVVVKLMMQTHVRMKHANHVLHFILWKIHKR